MFAEKEYFFRNRREYGGRLFFDFDSKSIQNCARGPLAENSEKSGRGKRKDPSPKATTATRDSVMRGRRVGDRRRGVQDEEGKRRRACAMDGLLVEH